MSDPYSKIFDQVYGGGQATGNAQYQLPEPQVSEKPIQKQFSDWNYQGKLGPNGEALPPGAEGWRPDGTPFFGDGIEGWKKESYYKISTGWFKGWQQGLDINEKAGYENDILPRLISAKNATFAGVGAMAQALLNPLGKLSQWTEQGAGTIGAALDNAVYIHKEWTAQDWKNNWEASRLAYNYAWNSFTNKGREQRQEFISRLNAGERPDFIAEDMQIKGDASPWVELGGNLLFDPLNALDMVAWAGKGERSISIAKKVNQEFNVIEAGDMLDTMKDAWKAGDKATATAKSAQAFEEQYKVLESTKGMMTALQKPGKIKDITSLPERVKEYMTFIPESRAQLFINRGGLVAENLFVSCGKNPDKLLDIIETMAKMSSPDKAEAYASFMKIFDLVDNPNLVFSKAGNEFAVIASEMVSKHGEYLTRMLGSEKKIAGMLEKVGEGEKQAELLSRAAKTPGEIAKSLLTTMQKTVEEMYPSASEMLKAADKIKEAAVTGEKVSDRVIELAEMSKKMTPLERKIGMVHNVLQDKAVGPVNKAFAKIYLGMSPGYAFRNMSQNSLQMFLDYGPEILYGKADDTIALANKFNQFPLDVGANYGAIDLSRIKEADTGEIVEKTDAWSIIKHWWKKGLDTRAPAADFEAMASRKIVGQQYIKSFKDALEPLAKDLSKDKRFSELLRNMPAGFLQDSLYKNFGDVAATMEEIRTAQKTGFVRSFTQMSNMPKNLQKFLGGHTEEVRKILDAETPEEASRITENLFNALDNQAAMAALDFRPNMTDAFEQGVAVAAQEGMQPAALSRYDTALYRVADDTNNTVANIVLQVSNEASGKGVNSANWPIVKETIGGWTKTFENVKINGESARKVLFGGKPTDMARSWDELKKILNFNTPTPMTWAEFKNVGWQKYREYRSTQWDTQIWEKLDALGQYLDEIGKQVDLDPKYRQMYDDAVTYAEKYRNLVAAENGAITTELTPVLSGTRPTIIAQIAKHYGLSSATEAGVDTSKHLLNIINKYGSTDFTSLSDPISLDMVNDIFAEYTKSEKVAMQTFLKESGAVTEIGTQVENAAEAVVETARPKPVNVPAVGGELSSPQTVLQENVELYRQQMLKYIEDNFSNTAPFTTKATDEALSEMHKLLNGRLSEIRLVSAAKAQAHRDFTLLNYGLKSYRDVALSYIYPYAKWYTGTYANYARRIVQQPAIIGHYQMMKDKIALAHAGLPDWWKYNLSTEDLPDPLQKVVNGAAKFMGLEDNALFMNLEATLWPLNGITGVDFTDQEKVVNWWTYGLDEMGKFGPTVWTPFQIFTGLYLRAKGEETASDKYLGRLSAVSTTVKTVTGAAGIRGLSGNVGVELDPMVGFFQGGYDSYEKKRIKRALAEIVAGDPTNTELQAQAIDASRTESGPLWDRAVQLSYKSRAPGQISSFLFGVGFKARTQSDMETDIFYNDYYKLMSMRENIPPEEFRNQMALLGEKYPFMDTLLVGRGSDETKDSAFAYNVLSRVPPGDMSGLLNFVGVSSEAIDTFYSNKGDLSKMPEDDRMRFNAAMVSLAAILRMPSTATKQEWNTAKFQYNEAQVRSGFLNKDGTETKLGEKLQAYYSLMDTDRNKARQFLDMNPDLQRAMDLKTAYTANNPILNAYYGGIETIEKYYQAQVRTQMVTKYGANIYAKYDYYNSLIDAKAKKDYLAKNPDLKAFKAEKGEWQDYVNRETAKLASKMPEGKAPELREAQTQTQLGLQQNILSPQRGVTAQELMSQMPPELIQMIQLYGQGQELSYAAQQQVDYLAGYYGITGNEALQIILSGQ